jgi:hypothetical protein
MLKRFFFLFGTICFLITACKKDNTNSTTNTPHEPQLIFKFQFDSTQQRLDNFGNPAIMATGHAGLNPKMNTMSAHYIELAQNANTQIGKGAILYHAPEVTTGGDNAIDFSKSIFAANHAQFYTVPLKSIAAGEYQYLRVSLSYENYDVSYHIDTTINVSGTGPVHVVQDLPITLASFVGFNTYLTNYTIKNKNVAINGNKKQDYWGAESSGSVLGKPVSYLGQGQALATTVVNPIASTSPIPAGSCVETGAFNNGTLKITGDETKDIIIIVSLSTNKSFEWVDDNSDGKWEPSKGEKVVDMGLRGLIPFIQ